MSPTAPPDRKLAAIIRTLVDERHDRAGEQVLYLDQHGAVLAELQPEAEPRAVLATRSDLLTQGKLGAVVHLSVLIHQAVRITIAEVFDDPMQPTIHALVTFSDNGSSSLHRWIPAPPGALDRWIEVWDGKEEQQDP